MDVCFCMIYGTVSAMIDYYTHRDQPVDILVA